MYREPAVREPEQVAPKELVVGGEARRSAPPLALFQLFSLPPIAGALLSVAVSPVAGLVGMVGAGAFSVWWWRRDTREHVVLRVEDGILEVLSKRRSDRLPLRDLRDVVLDTKTIQRIQDGASAIPAMRFIDSRVAPAVDTARIMLVPREPGGPIPLSKDYLSHMDATTWFGKTRVFLRKHGWVPDDEQDERVAPDSADERD